MLEETPFDPEILKFVLNRLVQPAAGRYAELREAMKIRDHLLTDLRVVQGRMHNWLDRWDQFKRSAQMQLPAISPNG